MASGQGALGPSQLLEPFRGWRFELGNPRIYIRPYVTLAEPADLQDFSKDKKNKPTRGTLAPGSLPAGKVKAQSYQSPSTVAAQREVWSQPQDQHGGKTRRQSSHGYFILKFITFGKSTVQGKTHWIK